MMLKVTLEMPANSGNVWLAGEVRTRVGPPGDIYVRSWAPGATLR
jgi:hypothetical protein